MFQTEEIRRFSGLHYSEFRLLRISLFGFRNLTQTTSNEDSLSKCCDYQNLNTIQPRSLKQATRALADLGADAMLVAGGTDVYPKMKRGQFTPRNLISLRLLRELKGIRQSKEGLWIGAGESLTAVSQSSADRKTFSRARSRRRIRVDAAAA